MSFDQRCRCCLTRPPDKDLNAETKYFEETEVYNDMLKECFEIHLTVGKIEGDGGICQECVNQLRESYQFKKQVLKCQKEFDAQVKTVKDEAEPKVKIEIADEDDDNDIFFLDLKEEITDYEDLKDEDDDKNLALLAFEQGSLKRKIKLDSKSNCLKKHPIVKNKTDRKKKLIGKSSISFKNLTASEKLAKIFSSPSGTSFKTLRENKKYARIFSNSTTLVQTYGTSVSKHQANIDMLLKHSNATPFSNKTIFGYVCVYCKKTLEDPKELRSHTTSQHMGEKYTNKKRDSSNISLKLDITDLKCNLCKKSMDVVANLKKHLITEHGIKFYKDVKDFVVEFKLNDSEILNCAICDSPFETFKMLLQHMNGHYRNYVCDVCDLGFINLHKLNTHKRTHELGEFQCSFCDKVFSTAVKKSCHEKYTHKNGARYNTNCPNCDQSFTSYYQRNKHMFKEHNVTAAKYKCNVCDKSFLMKSKLTMHIKKVHLMERNHMCPECGHGFFMKKCLEEHMIKHGGERIHKCDVCNKAYARKKTLREHMRIHNNDRRFKCGVCGMTFVQKCSMKSHMLSNHGVTLAEFENVSVSASQALAD